MFNVPGEGAVALIMGIISGYPTGAKVIVTLKEKDVLSSFFNLPVLQYDSINGQKCVRKFCNKNHFF